MTDLRRTARARGPWLWALAALTSAALSLAAVALVLLPADRPEQTLPPPPPPFLPGFSVPAALPSSAPDPGRAAAPVPATTTRRPATPTATRAPARPAAPSRARPATPPPAPDADVRGAYRVVDSFPDGFIGEVRITNTSGRDRDWTVRLRFPETVGDLRTSWVESAPQATLTTAGDTFTWSSGVPVAAGSTAVLRFQFARSGTDEKPRSCTVNSAACR